MADYLETLIDPFDLDVFTPHLHSNLNHLVQRTSVSRGRTRSLGMKGQALGSQPRPAHRVTGGDGQDAAESSQSRVERGLDSTSNLTVQAMG